jgi:lysophospholipase L1-like esterase
MTAEKQSSRIEQIELSRRGLFRGIGAAGLVSTLAFGGDTAPKPLESPIDKYGLVIGAGDSYAYGLGASSPEYGLADRLASRLHADYKRIARIGWSAGDMIRGKGGFPSQLDELPANANLVIITVGGNATNLRTFGAACIAAGCGANTQIFKDAFKEFASDKHYEDEEEYLRGIRLKAAGADAAVIGYPFLIVPYKLPGKIELFLEGVGVPELTVLGKANDAAIADLVEMSNTATKEIIKRIADPRLVYVEPPKHIDIISTRLLGQPDHFHIDPNPTSDDSGHPTNFGHEAIADVAFPAITAMYNRNKIKTGLTLHGMGMGK